MLSFFLLQLHVPTYLALANKGRLLHFFRTLGRTATRLGVLDSRSSFVRVLGIESTHLSNLSTSQPTFHIMYNAIQLCNDRH